MIHLPDKEKESKSEGLYKRLSKLWRFDFNFPYIAIQLRDVNTKEILDDVKILIQYPVTPRMAYFMLLQAQKNMMLKLELMKQSFPFFFGPTPSSGPQLSLLELYQTYFIEIDHK